LRNEYSLGGIVEESGMTREVFIDMLEQHIARLESSQADPQVDPNEEDQQSIKDALDDAKEILERIKAGDEGAIQEASDLLKSGVIEIFAPPLGKHSEMKENDEIEKRQAQRYDLFNIEGSPQPPTVADQIARIRMEINIIEGNYRRPREVRAHCLEALTALQGLSDYLNEQQKEA
jgi:hypothetical protein